MISDEHLTIILGNDAWETIRCHSCGANARLRRRLMDFMKGITGLASHYRQIHLREGGWSHEDVYASCLREALDPAVAQKILNGEPTSLRTTMDLGTNVMDNLAGLQQKFSPALGGSDAVVLTPRNEAVPGVDQGLLCQGSIV